MKKMIFHHPLPINKNSAVASGIRPAKMINAFEKIGYEVFLITGDSKERKAKIKELKKNMEKGMKYNFLYSESSTLPTLLTDNSRLPFFPFLDYSFFQFIKSKKIPIGLFYRDIYWKFTKELSLKSRVKYNVSNIFFKYDLFWYKKTLNRLYLPSIQMYDYVSDYFPKEMVKELPPGHDNTDIFEKNKNNSNSDDTIRVLYVGGLSNHYQMHLLFKTIKSMKNFELTICTRKDEWESIKKEYMSFLSSNIHIVHKSGVELKALYKECDIVSIFVQGTDYWRFAAPLKLYEYLGEAKPIIAVDNTLAGEFVSKNKIGWKVPYDLESLSILLKHIEDNRRELAEKTLNCESISKENTWLQRAQQVEDDLITI